MVFNWGDLEYSSATGFLLGETPTFEGQKISTGLAPAILPVGASAITKMFGTGKTISKAPEMATGIGKWGYAAVGTGIGLLGGLFFSGKTPQTQEASQKASQQTAPQESKNIITPVVEIKPFVSQPNYSYYYQNQYTYDYSSNYNIISNSPNSSIYNKKTMQPGMSATSQPSWTTPFSTDIPSSITSSQGQTQEQKQGLTQGQFSGTDLTKIALIAGIALVAYGVVKGK